MPPVVLLVLYCVLVFAASLAGGRLPALLHLTHRRMQVLISLVAGLMLGVGMFHLIPHAALEIHSVDQAMLWAMIGMLVTFFLIRVFHFHEHGTAEQGEPHDADPHHDCGHDHDHDHDHAHDHDDGRELPHSPASAQTTHGTVPATTNERAAHRLSWVGMGLGLSIHTLLDGIALAASVDADAQGHGDSMWAGVGTFLAVFLHKPLDSMSLTALMAAGGWSVTSRRIVNTVYALICPLGALLFWMGVRELSDAPQLFVGSALAFSGGVFLCIALSDLLPEIQFHAHDQIKLSLALLLGVALAWSVRYLEPAHIHDDAQPEQPGVEKHDSHDARHKHEHGHKH